MMSTDLAIAWNWEYDEEFILGIEMACSHRRISTYRIEDHNLAETLRRLSAGELSFRAFYDRASDADADYLALQPFADTPEVRCFNPRRLVLPAADKATMHLELITHGVNVPNTIILPPASVVQIPDVEIADLERIGIPFVIKPANTTGGGKGVIMGASEPGQIARARLDHPDDKYLVQETIHPMLFDGRRAWFRAYFAFGRTILCWWDDQTHQYSRVESGEELQFGLGGLRQVVEIIRRACGLDFFSSEIAITPERRFIVVDYVNEICDMRKKSSHENGAPDDVVAEISNLLADATLAAVRSAGTKTGSHG